MGFWDDNPDLLEPGGVAGAAQGAPVGPDVQAAAPAAPSWTPGAKAGQNVTLLGFDQSKMADPNYTGSVGKYDAAAHAFNNSIGQDVGWTRGSDNSNAINYLKANGFGNAKMVGDDKVDFGDGNGPVDIFRSDGSLVFQNTTGNSQWEGQHGGPSTAPSAAPSPGGGANPYGNFSGGGGSFSGGGGGGYGGGGGATGSGWDGQKFTATSIGMPTDYNPTATAGPQSYTPQQIQAQQVQGPDALHAQQIANAEKFGGVSAADLAADPGMQFRLDQGSKAFMANKAAQGVARTGGAIKGLQDYNQNAASQEYGNVYNRKFGEYQTGLADRLNVGQANNAANAQAYGLTNQYQQGAALANQGANLSAQGQNAANGLQAWQAYQGMNQQNQQFNAGRTDTANQNNFANRFTVQNANNANAQNAWQGNTNAQLGQGNLNLGYTSAGNQYGLGMANVGLGYHQADQSYALGQGNLGLGYLQANNAYSLGQGQQQLGWAGYGLNADQQGFNQGYSLANMGLTAAGAYGNYAGQYGQNAGNYATQQGNAGAAGAVGGANAWNQGLAGAYNGAAGAYGLYLAGQNPQGNG